jgi:hypothetical protein
MFALLMSFIVYVVAVFAVAALLELPPKLRYLALLIGV